jgi:hypothetical protein
MIAGIFWNLRFDDIEDALSGRAYMPRATYAYCFDAASALMTAHGHIDSRRLKTDLWIPQQNKSIRLAKRVMLKDVFTASLRLNTTL